ncbi:hypothetical protein E3N88_10970 [Mikania micrantha]|uniref:Uncharacterized protein n=1 Tax=Mikania micrantha TaxID=192012 RepID=A0A5N6LDS3_9ASTR|nr:hypothetical protein E3N88_43835 [Mikania micrantha]KAD6119699.1 hypothetical protein E3N88_10970 [Mikania micrantha]
MVKDSGHDRHHMHLQLVLSYGAVVKFSVKFTVCSMFQFEEMTGAKIIGSVAAAFVVAFTCTTPSTVSNKDWWEETDKKFQAWPRTAGPPVVMNPISRQNFIVKPRAE